jgi:hypothetical protein
VICRSRTVPADIPAPDGGSQVSVLACRRPRNAATTPASPSASWAAKCRRTPARCYRQFAPYADLYRRAAAQSGHDASALKLSINSPGFLAATHREAIEVSHPYFESGWMANHHQRGQGVPMPLAAYEAQSAPAGAFFLGSPQEVTDKILDQWELFHHDRMTIQMGFGNVPQREMLKSIELLGTEVAPVVRKEIASRPESAEEPR